SHSRIVQERSSMAHTVPPPQRPSTGMPGQTTTPPAQDRPGRETRFQSPKSAPFRWCYHVGLCPCLCHGARHCIRHCHRLGFRHFFSDFSPHLSCRYGHSTHATTHLPSPHPLLALSSIHLST